MQRAHVAVSGGDSTNRFLVFAVYIRDGHTCVCVHPPHSPLNFAAFDDRDSSVGTTGMIAAAVQTHTNRAKSSYM